MRSASIAMICILSGLFAKAQQKNTDSLIRITNSSLHDTLKAKAYGDLAIYYGMRGEIEVARSYNEKLKVLSDKSGFVRGQASYYSNEGNINRVQNRLDKAIQFYFLALQKFEMLGDVKFIANTYNSLGGANCMMGNYLEGANYLQKAVEYRKRSGEVNNLASTYNNLATAYENTGRYADALSCLFESLKISEKLNDRRSVAISLGLMAQVFSWQGKHAEALEKFSEALKIYQSLNDHENIEKTTMNMGVVYRKDKQLEKAIAKFRESLQMAQSVNDSISMGITYGNLGGALCDLRQYDSALKYQKAALSISTKYKDQGSVATNLISVGTVLLDMKKYSEAEKYLLDGYNASVKLSILENMKTVSKTLSNLFEKTNRQSESFFWYKRFVEYKDSLTNDEMTRKSVQAQMQFEFDKKEQAAKLMQEKKDVIAHQEKQKQNMIRNVFIGGFVLSLFVIVLVYKGYRNKQKANKIILQQKKEVEASKEIIETQKLLVEEKQQEILDSINYAKRIQTAQMASLQYIQKNLSKLRKGREN